jgi:hypothetical protein
MAWHDVATQGLPYITSRSCKMREATNFACISKIARTSAADRQPRFFAFRLRSDALLRQLWVFSARFATSKRTAPPNMKKRCLSRGSATKSRCRSLRYRAGVVTRTADICRRTSRSSRRGGSGKSAGLLKTVEGRRAGPDAPPASTRQIGLMLAACLPLGPCLTS